MINDIHLRSTWTAEQICEMANGYEEEKAVAYLSGFLAGIFATVVVGGFIAAMVAVV